VFPAADDQRVAALEPAGAGDALGISIRTKKVA
jgi:hypothetical protein